MDGRKGEGERMSCGRDISLHEVRPTEVVCEYTGWPAKHLGVKVGIGASFIRETSDQFPPFALVDCGVRSLVSD